MTVVHGDFYEVDFPEPFDVVCYIDGFEIGTDADQRRLLRRVAGWLEPDGCALIDVYTCFDAFRGDGKLEREGDVIHRYAYDPDGNRMLASEWPAGADESEAVAQSLRSYTPADFRLLREGTGLAMDTYQPFGDEGPTRHP